MPRPSRDERLHHITEVATRLFQRDGYETTSINDIANELDMSVGGLYRYIATKSDLLELVCEGIYGDLPIDLADIQASALEPGTRLHALLDSYLETCARNRRLILLMYREYRHLPSASQDRFKEREQAIAGIFSAVLDECRVAGVVGAVDSELLALDIVLLGHLPALKGWALHGTGPAESEVAKAQTELVESLLGGLTKPRVGPSGAHRGQGATAPLGSAS